MVERTWIERASDEEHQPKPRYFISSMACPDTEDPAIVKAFAIKLGWEVRRYWGVENGQHWRRDVVWREDTCTRCGPRAAKATALLRATELSVLRLRHPSTPTPDLLDDFSHDTTKAITFLKSQK
jgi:hypothetical protein